LHGPVNWSPDRVVVTKDGVNADDAAKVLGVSHQAMFSLRFATTMNRSVPTSLCS
jgi:hypothetical protein